MKCIGIRGRWLTMQAIRLHLLYVDKSCFGNDYSAFRANLIAQLTDLIAPHSAIIGHWCKRLAESIQNGGLIESTFKTGNIYSSKLIFTLSMVFSAIWETYFKSIRSFLLVIINILLASCLWFHMILRISLFGIFESKWSPLWGLTHIIGG